MLMSSTRIKYLLLVAMAVFLYFQIKEYMSDENVLDRSLETYKQALLNKNHEMVVEYLYPKLYKEKTSKELLYRKIERYFERTSIGEIELTPSLPIRMYSKGIYVLVDYSKKLTIKVPYEGKTDVDKRARRASMFFLQESLKKGDTLQVDKSTDTVDIEKHGTLIFLKQNGSGWKCVDVEATPKKVLIQSLPMDIIDQEQVLILRKKDSMFQKLFHSGYSR